MAIGRSFSIGTLQQPEYTGENRCIPCTAINVAIAVVGATIFAIAIPLGWYTSSILGVFTFALFVTIIYFRGYLLPGTPWLTMTYLPDSILRHFDHHPVGRVAWDGDGVDLERTLMEADIVRECHDEVDLCLRDDFRQAWTEGIVSLREQGFSQEDVASFLTIDPDELSFEESEGAFLAKMNGAELAQWESHAAFLADMAALTELRSRIVDWDDVGVKRQSNLLYGLRVFLESCPACEGPLVTGQKRVKSCCRSFDVIATQCDDCGSRLFEAEVPD